jgi:hypothetical protein
MYELEASPTPTVLPFAAPTTAGPTGIFASDFIGSGQIGNPLPVDQTSSSCGTMGGQCDYSLYHVGAFMRSLGPQGLTNAVNNYNSSIGGTLPTPAGQALSTRACSRFRSCKLWAEWQHKWLLSSPDKWYSVG